MLGGGQKLLCGIMCIGVTNHTFLCQTGNICLDQVLDYIFYTFFYVFDCNIPDILVVNTESAECLASFNVYVKTKMSKIVPRICI